MGWALRLLAGAVGLGGTLAAWTLDGLVGSGPSASSPDADSTYAAMADADAADAAGVDPG